MARKQVPHEITLTAWSIDPDNGGRSIFDIIETSYHFASRFTRQWMRCPDIEAISAFRPGRPTLDMPIRQIRQTTGGAS